MADIDRTAFDSMHATFTWNLSVILQHSVPLVHPIALETTSRVPSVSSTFLQLSCWYGFSKSRGPQKAMHCHWQLSCVRLVSGSNLRGLTFL